MRLALQRRGLGQLQHGAARVRVRDRQAERVGGIGAGQAIQVEQAARLAVMLPRPRYYEQNFRSGYLGSRASTIAARARGVALP